ncbi:HTH-type transcriptional activator RhaS [bioreactor metagenome]|uniref:HTH-type transcriptional activator RhaS n=1 Tax=bioreactor metagenome TaxID=1076179 RepID=A0A645F520_9ZZZZ
MKEPRFQVSGFPEETIAEIRDELLNPELSGVADRLDQLAIRLFTEILLKFREGETPGKTGRLKLHAIAAELRRGRTLAPLLKKYGYSERSFYREWRKLFRLTPNAYKLRHMLDSAGTLLTESDLSPAEIAARCGFGSTVYFYEQFRKHYGTTPQKFRKTAPCRLFPREQEEKPENGN